MRFRLGNRFYVLCGVAACSMLYSAWFLSTRTLNDLVSLSSHFETAKTFDRRLVVFGDSWSDNKTNAPEGPIWTDWLCSMFSCHQENLAASMTSLTGKETGAVIDNKELGLVGRLSQMQVAGFDFKTQLEKWLVAEKQTLYGLSEEDLWSRQQRTIFAVSFGVWDIWDLVQKDYDTAVASIDRRMESLLGQLNQLSDRWGSSDIKLILTQTVDVTFLPAFEPTFSTSGTEYKESVKIIAHWNAKMRETLASWDRARGLGANTDPGWENVADGCVESMGFQVMMSKGAGEKARCEHPDKYLFWDGMTLGPSVHRLMGTEIYQGISEAFLNQTPAGERESQTEKRHSRGSAA
ncbi:hypothetical protein N7468_008616 [Penicillium chermesinum]|uniref:Uncharacterized protein n=1 Tax=Penicillium chermesinum TaxID=63820 RepID=A0A9W9TIU0_9EURO|nr:uncharacterized protein N7468_008616 [Penicillium chermesinum]KAJ5224074.1 hypothetical protein N7468_008616 [Penicillium chermesinum]